MTEATISGRGLHSGLPVSVSFARRPGPLAFRTERGEATVGELRVVRADRGVRVACDATGVDVDGIEHCLAALGGLGIRSGVLVTVRGGELPLADGGALAFARALLSLDLAKDEPELVVRARGEVRRGATVYTFEPAERVDLVVDVSFDARAIGEQRATWDGTRSEFLEAIAWARTFGFAHEAEALHASGRARGAAPEDVMVLDPDGVVLPPGKPARPGEFARHKLLDLIGDLYLAGGPPRGVVRATRPGHAATRAALEEALARGIVAARGGPREPQSL